jgi:hypothetical protein
MTVELTKDIIERAFDAMGQIAAERGLVVEIAVYGGSFLVNRTADNVDKIQSYLDDAVALMKMTRISTREALVDLFKECYPNIPGIAAPAPNPRINVKLDALMDAYARSTHAPDPTWNAGTGPATCPR